MNLLTRIGWEARRGVPARQDGQKGPPGTTDRRALPSTWPREVVDCMLFRMKRRRRNAIRGRRDSRRWRNQRDPKADRCDFDLVADFKSPMGWPITRRCSTRCRLSEGAIYARL
jgi:hypothetical protein